MKSVPPFLQANQLPTVYSRAMANRFRSAAWSFAFLVNRALRLPLADGIGTFRLRDRCKTGSLARDLPAEQSTGVSVWVHGFSKDSIFKELRIAPQSENKL